MKNPFEDNTQIYTAFIKQQIETMKVDESKQVNLDGRDVYTARSTLSYLYKSIEGKYKTRTNVDGELWIKRIK